MKDYYKILKNTELFSGISEDEFDILFKKIRINKKNYSKKHQILNQGDRYKDLFILIKGRCFGEMIDYSGKIAKIEEFKAPYILASAVLFSKENLIPVSVKSREECTVLSINKNDILKLCLLNKNFFKNFITDISDKFNFISKKLSFMAFKTIKEKLCNYLLNQQKDKDGNVILTESVEEIANIFGVSRPSLSRVIIQMEEKKIISKTGKTIKILNKDKLTE